MTVLQDGELVLYGFVGETFWDEGFSATDVIAALAEIGRTTDVTVRINSGGGYAADGIAIYNSLMAHKGKVTVVVDAIAASAASIIAMAGDTTRMRAGSLMMIHDPEGITVGTAADHAKTSSTLDKMADQMAGIYSDRSKQPVDTVRQAMKDETWMTADEAVEQGYADESDDSDATAVAAFDYRAYAHAPDRLTALAETKRWTLEAGRRPAASAPPQKDPPMTDTPAPTPQPTPAADIDKAKAEAAGKAALDATNRITAVLSADGIKGDAARMTAAIDLAAKAPAMSADEVVTFVTANVAVATAPGADTPEGYVAGRTKGLASPQPSLDKAKAAANRILDNYRAVTGFGAKT